MIRVRAPLALAMSLALTALSVTSARADEPELLWSARPSVRLSSMPALNASSISPLPAQSEGSAAGVVFGRNGRISLSADIDVDAADHSTSFATLPWCAEASGLLRVGALGRDCLMQGTVQLELPGRIATAGSAAQWRGDRFDLSLAYGYSWMLPGFGEPLDVPYLALTESSVSLFSPQPLLPGMSAEAKSLGLNSQWRLTAESALQLNAALQQLRLQSGRATPVFDLQRAMLGIGMNYGAFSGNVTGHVQRLNEPGAITNPYFSGIDIGVSWRTPWRGELTLGARNVVSKPVATEPMPAERELVESTTRTPYVRYKQDL